MATIIAQEQQSSGTDAGTASPGWNDRALNTIRYNSISGASLSGNVVTLPAGDYIVRATAPIGLVANGQRHRLHIRDVGGSVLASGANQESSTSGRAVDGSTHMIDKFSLTADTDVVLSHYITGTAISPAQSSGLGAALNTGDPEVYSMIIITQL